MGSVIANSERQSILRDKYQPIVLGLLVLIGIYFTSLYSYLLFHTLVEVFSAVIALGIFVVVWNSRRFLDNNYLLFIGIALFSVGLIVIVHTLAYRGMNILQGYDANLPTQLWITSRYILSLSLLIAPWLIGRKLRAGAVFASFAVVTALALAAIFLRVFPDCYIEGAGLTAFKIISEYVISAFLLAAAFSLYVKRQEFDRDVLRILIASVFVAVVSEVMFTLYVGVYDLFNMIGHLLVVVSFYLIYKGILETGLNKPYNLLFRKLKQSEELLQKSHDELEIRVRERTAELVGAQERLRAELAERKKAEEALMLANQEWEKTFNAFNDAVCLLDASYKILRCNKAMEELLDKPREQIIGRFCFELMHGGSSPIMSCPVNLMTKTHSRETMPLQIGDRWYNVTGDPILDSHGDVMGAVHIITDVTEKKKAEDALHDSEEFSTSLLTGSPNPILVINPDYSIEYVNPALEKLTGFSPAEVIGIKPPYPWWTKEAIEQSRIDFERIMRREIDKAEQLFTKKSGEKFWVEITSESIMQDGKPKYYLRTYVDVTERKRLMDDLRFYANEITRAEEAERKRIACELHDDTAQALAAVAIEIDDLVRRKELDEKSIERLKELRIKTGSILEGVRRISYNLRPGVIDHLGLIPALEVLTEEMNKDGKINARLDVSGLEDRLPPDIELALFRIAQESLNNVRKYSQATEVAVNIGFGQGIVRLKIVDNGNGFKLPDSMGNLLGRRKLGLVGMQERARSIGGTCSVQSQPGKGTTVTAEITTESAEADSS